MDDGRATYYVNCRREWLETFTLKPQQVISIRHFFKFVVSRLVRNRRQRSRTLRQRLQSQLKAIGSRGFLRCVQQRYGAFDRAARVARFLSRQTQDAK